MVAVVAITVVESEAGEPPRQVARGQATVHLVEADDVDVELADVRQRQPQKLRRDLEMTVRLECVAARRPHVMQHEDRAGAAEDRAQQASGAGEVEGFKSGANDAVTNALHRLIAPRPLTSSGTRRILTATLEENVSHFSRTGRKLGKHLEIDTRQAVCFVSFRGQRSLDAHALKVGPEVVARAHTSGVVVDLGGLGEHRRLGGRPCRAGRHRAEGQRARPRPRRS